MSTRKFALLLAGALMVPQAALGGEAGALAPAQRTEGFALPPIPYAETIPWLAHTSQPRIRIPRLGLWMKPATLDFAAVRIEPATPLGDMLPYTVASQAPPNAFTK